MIRLITNFDQLSTTVTAAAVSADTGELWAAAVLQYQEDASGPSQDLQNLTAYGNHISDEAPDDIKRLWGDLIHGAFCEWVLDNDVKATTAWEALSKAPSGTRNEVLSHDRLLALIALARSGQPEALKPVSH